MGTKLPDDEELERLFEQMSPEVQKEIDNQHTPRLITEFTYNNFVYLETGLIDLKIEFKYGHYEVCYKTGYCPESGYYPESGLRCSSCCFCSFRYEDQRDGYQHDQDI